ncbi:mRNA interferase toxin RelE [Commensalibacter sp. Nvir]|uniref:type II toxin-antitoxin system RelE family toxin n=1 Tax=Commensalibacter sp. Nvir TaxID=3069817 RepID=UPI002D54C40E|nr:mRNA interferase toxin RelE [Commensalibacter sp. Nvir]
MIYELQFDERALKEFKKLDKPIRDQFKKKLKEIQINPHIETARLKGDLKECYKIKLRSSGFRLVYQVIEKEIIIVVIAVGKREHEITYKTAYSRKKH